MIELHNRKYTVGLLKECVNLYCVVLHLLLTSTVTCCNFNTDSYCCLSSILLIVYQWHFAVFIIIVFIVFAKQCCCVMIYCMLICIKLELRPCSIVKYNFWLYKIVMILHVHANFDILKLKLFKKRISAEAIPLSGVILRLYSADCAEHC